jgi:UbiD family decarboxylase
LYAVIAMKQRYANEARHVILSAMSSNVRPKWIVVVDPDINVHDSAEVEWALSFRVDPGRDVILVNNVPSAPLDPSSHGDSLQEKTNSTRWSYRHISNSRELFFHRIIERCF